MPSQEDMQRFAQLNPNADKELVAAFGRKFSGVDGETHAKALKELMDANKRIIELEREIEDIKRHYEAKLKA